MNFSGGRGLMKKKIVQPTLFEDCNCEIETPIKDLKHRKSRYSNLMKEIETSYDNIYEVDTSNLSFSNTKYNYVDLFAGCGGLSLGIKQAGFNKLVDVEILDHAMDTLKYNFPESHHYFGDIKDFNPKEYTNGNDVHLVVGGPPCQGFSVAGKRNPKDIRNQLFREYQRVVEELNPYFFILENVPGILTLDNSNFYKEIVEGFKELGYEVSVRILEVADYGVPQLRTRAIFIGNRFGLRNPYPKKQLNPEHYKSIDESISDLEDKQMDSSINHVWTKHSKKFEERIAQVGPGESLYETFADAYKRQRVGHPSMTIKENHGGTHLHYSLNRCISAREMARLQTFPDEFIFQGTHKQAFIQVGNAVPVLLAKNVGLAVMKAIQDYEKNGK